MPITERGTLGPGFEKRLKAALDGVVPPTPFASSARYRSATAQTLRWSWRLAPALIGIGAALITLTALAATGSPNPAIWTQRAGSAIESVRHVPATPKTARSPKPKPTQSTQAGPGSVSARPTPSGGHEGERSPEPTDRPEDSPRPKPSPTPIEGTEPSPSPTPSDHSGG
jgi:hypothetical protein